ncbi:MAG TPA: hypothetical protein VGX00_08295 [Thermoplasmata archaeon]|nr:hypothetical protein [Thermoplasmata archaeon]
MLARGARPPTLTALSNELPPGHTPGVFPRRYVLRGETVLFETRPSLLSRYWGRLTIYILLLLLFIAATFAIPTDPATEFFDGLVVVLIAYTILAWRGSAYALTDRRVLSTSGPRSRSFQEMTLEDVHNLVQSGDSTGRLTFDTGVVRNPTARLSLHRTVKIVWSDLPNTPQVYRYAQDLFAVVLVQARQARDRQALMDRAREFMVTCAYCSAIIDIRRIESDPPKCPRCGAPFLPPDVLMPSEAG